LGWHLLNFLHSHEGHIMKFYGVRGLKFLKIEAIVLYPFILFHSKSPSEDIINHERIHWDQIKHDGIGRFYCRYLKEYFSGRFNGLKHDEAYRNISYEKEAYSNQNDSNYQISKFFNS